jgi:hypothetical protein
MKLGSVRKLGGLSERFSKYYAEMSTCYKYIHSCSNLSALFVEYNGIIYTNIVKCD